MAIFTAHPLDHFQSTATSTLSLLDCHTVIFNPSFEAAVISIPTTQVFTLYWLVFPQKHEHRSEMGWVFQQRSWFLNFIVFSDHCVPLWKRGLRTVHRLSGFLHPSPSVSLELSKEHRRSRSVSFGTMVISLTQRTASPIFPPAQCPLIFSRVLMLWFILFRFTGSWGPGLLWG